MSSELSSSRSGRRCFLAAVSGALVAGCVSAPTADDSPSVDDAERSSDGATVDGWTMSGYDASNSGYNADSAGPDNADSRQWRTDVDGVYTLSAPSVVGDRVYVASHGHVYALDTDDGSTTWRATPVDADEAADDGESYDFPRGFLTHAFSPAVTESALIAGARQYDYLRGGPNPGELFALSVDDGALEWRLETHLTTSPTVAEGLVFLGNTADDRAYVNAIDPTTGDVDWETALGEDGTDPRVLGTPAVADGVVHAASFADGESTLVALDAADGDLVWEQSIDDGVEVSPVVADGRVFVVTRTGHLLAFESESGDAVWEAEAIDDPDAAPPVRVSPAVADGSLYVLADAVVSAYDTESGDRQWDQDLEFDVDMELAVSSDAVYIGGSNLTAFDADSGERLWEKHIGRDGGEFGAPAIVDGALYVAACNKTEESTYIYDNDIRMYV